MKKAVFMVGLMVLSITMCVVSAYAEYPDKPITYIIPFNPGGESDITARLQEPVLEKMLGVAVNVTHKPGGGGAVGWSEFQRTAKPDGYSIIGVNIPHIIAQPILRKDAGFTADGFDVVMWFQFTPNVLMVPAKSKINSLDDFIKYAKANPRAATVGGSGSNTANHLETLHLAKLAGIQMTYIPHTGTGAVVPALLGGHITAAMNYSMVAVQYKDQVKSLAVASDERLEMLPDVPTFKELGYDIVGGAYRGVAVPKGTPQHIVEKLAKAFTDVNKAVASKQVPLGFVMTYASGDQAGKVVGRMKQNYEGIINEIIAAKKN